MRESESLPALLEEEGINVTMFADWFESNKRDTVARELTYAEIPQKYVWHEQENFGNPGNKKMHWGPKTFEALVTVNKRLCGTFKEACFAYGLLNDDKE
ncbi:hypothetical protein Tco_0349476 [Tanacetum coccineum]